MNQTKPLKPHDQNNQLQILVSIPKQELLINFNHIKTEASNLVAEQTYLNSMI